MNGVYCLANDGIYEHFIAFIKSFRRYNPTLPLTVILFDDNFRKIEVLSRIYNFDLWVPPDAERMYNMGKIFYPDNVIWQKGFKKICSFWGKYETFIFLDADLIVLQDLNPILQQFNDSDFSFLYFDHDPDWVYNDILFREKMEKEFESKHFNAGTWGGKKNVLSFEAINEIFKNIDQYKDKFVQVMEQPFLNYCIDIQKIKKVRLDDLDNRYAFSFWYNLDFKTVGRDIHWIYNGIDKGITVAMHWAGCNFYNIYSHPSSIYFLKHRLYGENLYYKYRYFLKFYHLTSFDLIKKIHFRNFLKVIFFS